MHRLLLVLSLVLVLGLTACGGDDKGGSSEPSSSKDGATVYADAVSGLDKLESGRFDARLDTVLRLNDSKITVTERGAFTEGGGTKLPKLSLAIGVEQSGGKPQKTDAVNTGEDFFVREDGATEFKSQGAAAVKQLSDTYAKEQGEIGQGRLPLLSLTPADWAKSPRVEGEETFEGEKVQRVVADLDVPAFLKDLETGKNAQIGMGVTLSDDARDLLEPGAKTKVADLTALVAEDGTLRRLTAKLDGEAGGGVNVDFDVKLTELGEPQEIEPPTT